MGPLRWSQQCWSGARGAAGHRLVLSWCNPAVSTVGPGLFQVQKWPLAAGRGRERGRGCQEAGEQGRRRELPGAVQPPGLCNVIVGLP